MMAVSRGKVERRQTLAPSSKATAATGAPAAITSSSSSPSSSVSSGTPTAVASGTTSAPHRPAHALTSCHTSVQGHASVLGRSAASSLFIVHRNPPLSFKSTAGQPLSTPILLLRLTGTQRQEYMVSKVRFIQMHFD